MLARAGCCRACVGERFARCTGSGYGALQAAGDCLIALFAEKTLACVDPSLERVVWSVDSPSEWTTFRPLVDGATVIAGNADGELIGLDSGSGETLWTRQLAGDIKSVALAGDMLYVGTQQGELYAVRAPDGRDGGP